jgi:hypothetical protein
MKTVLRIFLLIALLGGAVTAAEPAGAALVVSVGESPNIFAQRSKTTGETVTPGIEIYADGTTIIRSSDGEHSAKRIDVQRLAELLAYFREQRLFYLTEQKLTEAMVKARGLPAPTDQTTTILFATADKQKVSLKVYAFPLVVENHPQVEDLQIMKRCIAKIYEITGEPRK